ncbi:MAG: triose-phosphate isomerase [Patescibacteria group bacterium]
MAVKKILIVGNWKMYPRTLREVESFVGSFKKNTLPKNTEVVIAPPFPFLSTFRAFKKAFLGAQDMYFEGEGAFTGAVSGGMLKSFGVSHVILGHSERREYFGETNETVNKKLRATIALKLHPIVCVGEKHRDHDGLFFNVVREQVERALDKVKRDQVGLVTIAYEPVWAIGAKKPAQPKDANEMALFIKKIIADRYDIKTARKVRVLYGGSVDGKNARQFLEEREIAGLLVGRQSREVKYFFDIIACAKNLS